MRHLFIPILLLCFSNSLFAQNIHTNLLRQAKEIYFALKNEAAGDNNQFKAQTVAFKKPNPDLSPDPDDDDPNTIKESLFLQVLLGSKNGPYEGYLVELRKSLSSITTPSETISLTNIQSHATKKSQNAFSPIGKVFWDNVIILCGDSNNTTKGTFAAALSQQINGYTKSFLENHYAKNVKSYKKDAQPYGDVDAADLAADIPTDTTFIETAADAYEKEAKAKAEAYQNEEEAKINNQNVETNKDAFVQYTSDFLNELVLGLKTCEQENYTIDIPKILTTWRTGLEIKVKRNFQPFLPLLKSIESLGKTTTANAFYAAVKSTIEKEFSLEKLKLMAPECADCNFGKMLPLARAKQYVQVVLNEKDVLQDAFVKFWLKIQNEWIAAISKTNDKISHFSVKKLKELEPDFQNAKFWFKDFKSALDKITKTTISGQELIDLLQQKTVWKDTEQLELEFSKFLGEQKADIKNFVTSLPILIPTSNFFLLYANYKP